MFLNTDVMFLYGIPRIPSQEYGILLLTSVALVVLGAVLLRQTRDNVDHSRSDRTQLLNSPQRL